MTKIQKLEDEIIITMLNSIASTTDPVEQYRCIERYYKFIEARRIRTMGDPMRVFEAEFGKARKKSS